MKQINLFIISVLVSSTCFGKGENNVTKAKLRIIASEDHSESEDEREKRLLNEIGDQPSIGYKSSDIWYKRKNAVFAISRNARSEFLSTIDRASGKKGKSFSDEFEKSLQMAGETLNYSRITKKQALALATVAQLDPDWRVAEVAIDAFSNCESYTPEIGEMISNRDTSTDNVSVRDNIDLIVKRCER